MDRITAITFLSFLLGKLGNGYHPDNKMGDYVECSSNNAQVFTHNAPTFTDEEAAHFDKLHDEMLNVLGDDIYQEIDKLSSMTLCFKGLMSQTESNMN